MCKQWKGFAGAMLCLILLMLLPGTAHAASSGYCGTNVRWTLDDAGALTISGSGAMYDYSVNATAPWGTEIRSVTVKSGVTSIGDYSFDSCSSLTSVTLPASVKWIGEDAFWGCSSLTEIVIPNSVTSIGIGAFSKCSNLQHVTMSDQVNTIGSFAFNDCSSLTGITIPRGVTTIETYSFANCSSLTEVVIPDTVTLIELSAFEQCSGLTGVTIPGSVKEIEGSAFLGCRGLKRVDISNGVERIADYVFAGCSSLERISIPGSVTYIGDHTFNYCSALREVHIESLKAWCETEFWNQNANPLNTGACDLYLNGVAQTDLVLPSDVETISRGAFRGWTGLKSVQIPDSVTNIDEIAFMGCTGLTEVTIPDSVTSIGEGAFGGCTGLTAAAVSGSVISGGSKAGNKGTFPYVFDNCPNIRQVEVVQGCETIGAYAFAGCSNLQRVTISDSVTAVDSNAFADCSSLAAIELPDTLTALGSSAFKNCVLLAAVDVPQSVTSLGSSVFYGCTGLTAVTLPETLQSIKSQVFYDCTSLKSIRIPAGVTKICYEAFGNCCSLEQAIIPDGVTEIEAYAFRNCSHLSDVKLPESVTAVGLEAFKGCTSLKSVTLPSGNTTFQSNAFSNCGLIEYVIIPGSQRPGYTLPSPLSAATVYCNEYSSVDFWALDNGYRVAYLSAGGLLEFSISAPAEELWVCECMTITPQVVAVEDDPYISWSSSDSSVASVVNGRVTALAAGTVTITATCGGLSDSITITVHTAVASIALSDEELWIVSKTTADLTITSVLPEGAVSSLLVSIADGNVASAALSDRTITVSGYVPGETVLTVTDEISGVSASCRLYVCYPVTQISFDEPAEELLVGDSAQLKANVVCRTQSFTNRLVTFASSDEAVVAVAQDGSLMAKAAGVAAVTAEAANGVSASCIIVVRPGTYAVLPEKLTSIEEEALMGSAVTWIILPDGVQHIGGRAFANCGSLVCIEIPTGVTDIAADAFDGCSGLTIMSPAGSEAQAYAQENGLKWIADQP